MDVPTMLSNGGYAGVYHEYDAGSWTGPTGYYRRDFRGFIAPDEAMVWSPLHVWADPAFEDSKMALSFKADTLFPPPRNRDYLVELLYVPEGITGVPTVGTVWSLPLDSTFTIFMPTYRSTDGAGAYQFSFTITPEVPEPGSLTLLLAAAVPMLVRRRK